LQVDAKKSGEEKRGKKANKGALRALRAENKEATKLKRSIYVRTNFSNDKKKMSASKTSLTGDSQM
jgi:hypothetical protein